MELLCKWNQLSLVKRILISLILGAVLGFLLPGASFLSLLGTLFVGALKALAPLLVFFLVLHSLAQHKKGAKSNMSTVIALYLIGTLLAALCAVVASFLFPSTLALAQEAASSAPGGIGEVLAQRIVDYREAHGPFRSVEELIAVEGIGEGKLEKLRELVTVEEEP